ncbi:MAG: hypothetical protein Q4E99_02835, partial [Bacillota bacterium]|nr:hypothetical protein [Bacillota bacterium]
MKKLLVLIMVLFLMCLGGCANTNEQESGNETDIEVVENITVPDFKIKICGAKITNKDLESYSIYKAHSSSINSSGTEHEVDYVGYRLKDLLEVAQVKAEGKATIICTDGYQYDYEGDLNADDVLIAITKDGEAFKNGPWFAPCGSNTTGDYAQDLDKIEIDGISSPLATGGNDEKNEESTEEIAFPQDPVSEDKTDKITFGDFCFKINGAEIKNADLEGLKIFRITVTTKNSKDVVTQSKYSGYV